MHNLKRIRERLGVTQKVLAAGLGCCQANVSNIESGQTTLLPETARKLIEFSESRGLPIDFAHVYGPSDVPLPDLVQPAVSLKEV
ncbi:transcriptional regulator, XRE family [Delftia acidovorans SPH-1]|uniref:Transcriptional regulator, XRE family n=1 Tax=Delftia acidovorans (strain DSM 14801 / SPH-1) TaxID=398578 RepID=A9BYC5_DELAS|nr:helix-turn-helix transcriptional regulator [Delftia acidovorans]ABX34264.1 transcriptional regulator, XRE family [Delftia acidovorans SPH-1]QPS76362.1 helix-turn-helix transcriptional regulator [Delftia acidovorans]